VLEKTRRSELSARTRRRIVLSWLFDGTLKVIALADLKRRPPSEIRGSKAAWAAAVALINAVGAAPIAYFIFGRRKPQS
jgi:hypothetical protein